VSSYLWDTTLAQALQQTEARPTNNHRDF
jgi:hypothetical protein